MDGCWDVKLASPQNAAGAKINDVIAKHMLTSQYEFLNRSLVCGYNSICTMQINTNVAFFIWDARLHAFVT